MKVALLTYSTKPRGGVVHTLALAEALADRGHDVTVWSLARGGDTEFFRSVSPSVSVQLVEFPDIEGESVGGRVVRSIARMRASLQSAAGYDVVHAQDCITANAAGPGCIRTVHHLDHFTTAQLVACHERALREPSTHVCVSSAVARELSAGWGISATVIPNGVEAGRFAAAALRAGAADRAAWWSRIGGDYVLSVGGIEPRKGTADLVEAMALVATARPDLRLVIGGGDTLFDYRDYRAEVLARAAALDVPLVMLGPVDNDALPALVAGASVFAFPSLAEGFGLAAMEALAAGVPLVTRDLPVLREVFGSAARFASTPERFASQILLAAGDPSPVLADAGRSLAAAHTWAAAAAAHEELYEQVLSG